MKWIRIWTEETLEGSTFTEMGITLKKLAFRGIWFSLLTLAGNSPIPGKICFTKDTGFTINQISKKLKVDIKLLKEALKFLASKRISKIKLFDNDNEIIIEIINWNKYQTEYERQKKYRDKGFGYKNRLQGNVTGKSYTTDEDEDEDEDEDKEFNKDSIEYKISLYLFKKIREHNPQAIKPNIQSWAKDVDLMIRRDKRKPEMIEKIIDWCQKDDFWHKNILSIAKLRKQFDRLILDVKDKKGNVVNWDKFLSEGE